MLFTKIYVGLLLGLAEKIGQKQVYPARLESAA